jgi:Ca-activated chloride channel family protein
MDTLTALLARVGGTLTQIDDLSLTALPLLHRNETVIALGVISILAVVALLARSVFRHPPGRTDIALPSLLPLTMTKRVSLSPLRHTPFVLFLAGLPFLAVALGDPHTTLIQERTTFPGHRIAIMIDASLSMDTSFATDQLGWGNSFLANVSAAEYFVRRRMNGSHRDLVALVEFGSEAYIVTPFTNDYENILLSLGLIGTPDEYDRFPDHGTLIMRAVSRGVQLFRTFDFLKTQGNLIVIFSDGQDTHAVYQDQSLDDILQEAADNSIPVYFIRTAYDQGLGDVLPDIHWKLAIEKTGGRFYPAADETAILQAVHEIDELSTGQIEVTQYVAHQPRYSPFALVALLFWTLALLCGLGVKKFQKFP